MPRPNHLPLELLQTFVMLAELEGDATKAAERLNISQPSISKRLSALRRLTTENDGQQWLRLKGKRWRLTAEGTRVQGVVQDLVSRYEQMERFVVSDQEGKSILSIACGQQAAGGFVRSAIQRFLIEHPDSRVRLSTPRGKARIEGVAGGQFDLAIVTDSPASIRQIARREMHIETLFEDRFVLVANPPSRSTWGKKWAEFPANRSIAAAELLNIPFILPEPDATRRQQFDEWFHRATGKTVEVVVEAGGWQTILEFAESGCGVGLVTQQTVDDYQNRIPRKITTRQLEAFEFPADAVRLVTRKAFGKDEPELSQQAQLFRSYLTSK